MKPEDVKHIIMVKYQLSTMDENSHYITLPHFEEKFTKWLCFIYTDIYSKCIMENMRGYFVRDFGV